jgi:small GTP-binding protein
MGKVKIKTVLLGDSGVGKTSIAVRLARDVFNDRAQPTVGAAFFTFVVENGEDSIQFEMWDTAGQERYRSLAPMYYRGAEVVVLVFALSDKQSFEAGERWLQDVRASGLGPTCTLVLVGNKADLEDEREVSTEDAEAFAAEQGMMYIESSAKTAKNVKEIMQNVASRLPEGAGVREEDAQAKRAADRRAGGRGGAVSVDDSSQAAGKAGGCC